MRESTHYWQDYIYYNQELHELQVTYVGYCYNRHTVLHKSVAGPRILMDPKFPRKFPHK